MTGDSGIDSKGHRGMLTACSGGQPGTGWPLLTQAALRLGAAAVTVPVLAHRSTYSCAAGDISTEVARTFHCLPEAGWCICCCVLFMLSQRGIIRKTRHAQFGMV